MPSTKHGKRRIVPFATTNHKSWTQRMISNFSHASFSFGLLSRSGLRGLDSIHFVVFDEDDEL